MSYQTFNHVGFISLMKKLAKNLVFFTEPFCPEAKMTVPALWTVVWDEHFANVSA